MHLCAIDVQRLLEILSFTETHGILEFPRTIPIAELTQTVKERITAGSRCYEICFWSTIAYIDIFGQS